MVGSSNFSFSTSFSLTKSGIQIQPKHTPLREFLSFLLVGSNMCVICDLLLFSFRVLFLFFYQTQTSSSLVVGYGFILFFTHFELIFFLLSLEYYQDFSSSTINWSLKINIFFNNSVSS